MKIPRNVILIGNLSAALMILTSCIFGYYQMSIDFFFPTLIISIYGTIIVGIIVSVMCQVKYSPLYYPQLEDINNQMKALLPFSLLLIQTSIVGTICGIALSCYSLICYFLDICKCIEAESEENK